MYDLLVTSMCIVTFAVFAWITVALDDVVLARWASESWSALTLV